MSVVGARQVIGGQCEEGGQKATRERIWASVEGPSPGTARRSASPLRGRAFIIRSARAGPIPGSDSSSWASAVFTFTVSARTDCSEMSVFLEEGEADVPHTPLPAARARDCRRRYSDEDPTLGKPCGGGGLIPLARARPSISRVADKSPPPDGRT
jgi:hypothetical protein